MLAKQNEIVRPGDERVGKVNNRKQRRNGKLTRANLLTATRGLIEQHGFNAVTLEQIAADVGVSKSSILWHFGSKENLLTESVLLVFAGLEAALSPDEQQHLSTEEKILHFLQVVAEYFSQSSTGKGVLLSLIFSRQTPPTLRTRLVEHYRNETKKLSEYFESASCPENRAEQLAAALVSLINGCYVQWHMENYVLSFHDLLLNAYQSFQTKG